MYKIYKIPWKLGPIHHKNYIQNKAQNYDRPYFLLPEPGGSKQHVFENKYCRINVKPTVLH